LTKEALPAGRGKRRVAIVHEWLASYAGFERVVEEILRLFPEADLFCIGRGGLAETVVEGQTGLFFAEQTPGSLIEAIATFETLRGRFDSDLIRRNAERFSRQRFQQEFSAFVEREYSAFLANDGVASSARQRIPQPNQSLKVAVVPRRMDAQLNPKEVRDADVEGTR
jgi:hypothetical protein